MTMHCLLFIKKYKMDKSTDYIHTINKAHKAYNSHITTYILKIFLQKWKKLLVCYNDFSQTFKAILEEF